MNIRMLKTFDELETIRAQWKQWQNHPNNDFDQFKMICGLRPEVESPCVAVIECNGCPNALLLGRLEHTQFAPSIGYVKPVRVSARVLVILHEGLLGQLDEEVAVELVDCLWSCLSAGLADVIEFHYLPENSPLLKALQLHTPGWLCQKPSLWSVHWEMTLPAEGTFIERKVKAKHRTAIRKRERELESDFRGRVAWKWMNRFDDIAAISSRLEEVAACAYQRGLGSGFRDNEEYRRRFALFASRGQLRVQLLEIDGRVRAFWFGYLYHDVFHLSETGYDPLLGKYEVGKLIFIRLSDELVREGVSKIDFGIGDAAYKQRFGDRSWREATVRMFAPTAKGMLLRSCTGLFAAADKLGRSVIQRMGMMDRLKTGWRRRLTPPQSSSTDLE